ncbi:MAG: SDR family oxidoreductase [Chloroflexi bacterium]|nr:SDR family oxidoreductase [Chloroflexota bacterium]
MTTLGNRLEGKVAIVTGASGTGSGDFWGIGEAIAILFARQGAKVLLVSRNRKNAENVLSQIKREGGDASFFAGDVTDSDACKGMVGAAVGAYGKLNILVNNVGIPGNLPSSVTDVEEDDWDMVMKVNLKSVMLTSKYAIPEMIKAGGGSIINMSSIAALQAAFIPAHAYSASKGGMMGLSKSMAVHYGRDNIRVNCVAIGQVHTPFVAAFISDEVRNTRRRAGPLGTEGTVWDVAWATVFLASDEARWISGVDLPVDAGLLVTTPLAMYPYLKDPE